jgi:hypothetical protein
VVYTTNASQLHVQKRRYERSSRRWKYHRTIANTTAPAIWIALLIRRLTVLAAMRNRSHHDGHEEHEELD